jgi:hypothetical protein
MMITMHQVRRFLVALLAVVTAGLVPASISSVPTVSAQSVDPGGEYFPILDGRGNPTVARVLDTRVRALDVSPFGAKQLNRGFDVKIAGRGGVPSSNVLAVLANVTVAEPSQNGYLAVGTAGTRPWPPKSSLVNFKRFQDVPNSQVLVLDSQGRVGIDLVGVGPGTAHVIIDVAGFIANSDYTGAGGPAPTEGARIVPVTPARFLDNRFGPVPSGLKVGAPLGAKQSIKMPVRGRAPVPSGTDVVGVVLNLTVENTRAESRGTYLAVTPELVPPSAPDAPISSTNVPRGVTKANLVFAPLSSDGAVYIYNKAGQTNVIADVVGYLTRASVGDRTGRVLPLGQPFRSFDTRLAEFGNARLPQGSWEDWSYKDFASSVKYFGSNTVVGAQLGFIGNLTGTGLTPVNQRPGFPTYITVQPGQRSLPSRAPSTSTLNFTQGNDVANSTLVRYGNNGAGDRNRVAAYNSLGRTHYLMDVYAVILAD